MDYRYDTKEEARDFHKKRVALEFIDESIKIIKSDNKMNAYKISYSDGKINEEVL